MRSNDPTVGAQQMGRLRTTGLIYAGGMRVQRAAGSALARAARWRGQRALPHRTCSMMGAIYIYTAQALAEPALVGHSTNTALLSKAPFVFTRDSHFPTEKKSMLIHRYRYLMAMARSQTMPVYCGRHLFLSGACRHARAVASVVRSGGPI